MLERRRFVSCSRNVPADGHGRAPGGVVMTQGYGIIVPPPPARKGPRGTTLVIITLAVAVTVLALLLVLVLLVSSSL